MRIPTIAALFVLLAACGEAPAQDPDLGEMPARTQAEPSGTGGAPTYAQMKQAAAIFAEEEYGESPLEPQEDYLTGEMLEIYDVINCDEEFENVEIGDIDPRQEALEKLARRAARHEHFLSQMLDPAIFGPALAAYEDDYRQLIATMPPLPQDWSEQDPAWQRYQDWEAQSWALEERLAGTIEAGRVEHGVEGVSVRAEGGCGAGETPYSIATSPAGGTVWLTTKFSFDLCGVRGLDRWNTEDCRWTEIGSADETHYLSGRYAYQARWPDGRTRRGVRNFSADDFDPDALEPARVTIAAP